MIYTIYIFRERSNNLMADFSYAESSTLSLLYIANYSFCNERSTLAEIIRYLSECNCVMETIKNKVRPTCRYYMTT